MELTQQPNRLGEVAQVAVEHGLVELARVVWRARRADRRIVRRCRPWLESLPCHPQPHDIEPQPSHERRVGRREVPGLARCRIELERRELVHGVDSVEEHNPAPLVVEKWPARRPEWTLDGRRPSDRRRVDDGRGEIRHMHRGRAGTAGQGTSHHEQDHETHE